MITIQLPSKISDDLNWIEPKKTAFKAIDEGKKIFWEFDLGLTAPYFPLEDELIFHSLCLSLTTFSKELWPFFQEHTESASLYRGSADFSSFFSWSEKQLFNWNSWQREKMANKEKHLRRLFCADAFAFYFQMLTYRLPDELSVTLTLNGKDCGTLAETLQLVSKERFEHFILDLQEIPLVKDSLTAVCFPQEAECSQEILEKLDELFDCLEKPLRVIPELFLTESWDEVEYLFVLSDALSQSGKRKLIGFCAAGGTVITLGKKIGLSQEIGIEEIRGRGIRTPGLLVPNQSR